MPSNKTKAERTIDLKGRVPESWYCIDCGVNTAPGLSNRADTERAFAAMNADGALWAADEGALAPQEINDRSEVYHVRDSVWQAAGMGGFGGCLCIGCL